MEKIKKLFGNFPMTWTKTVLFAVIAAAYTALVNELPVIRDTSFGDIAVTYECWFLFAIFIAVNCKTWWESALKCFVFFLVSQPLIFLLEVPFERLGWGVFTYYPHWFFITLLTLPGGAAAFLLKKKNWLSVLVLAVATGYLSYACADYFRMTQHHFPYHLLTTVFCLALAVFLIFVLLDEKKHRLVSLLFVAAVLAVSFFVTKPQSGKELLLPAGTWTVTAEDDSVVDVKIEDGNRATVTAKKEAMTKGSSVSTVLLFENADGTVEKYDVTVSGGSIWLAPYE